MKTKFLLFLLVGISYIANAQEHQCGNELLPPEEEQESVLDHCFDVEYVFENCIPVYLNMNVHFFLDGDCTGSPIPWDQSIEVLEAFEIAENIVNEANDLLANNELQNQSPQFPSDPLTEAHCNPLRYTLAGIYFHCEDDKTYNGTGFQQFNINDDSEINLYITASNGSWSGVGYSSLSLAQIDWLNARLLNHEIGHVLKLNHSWVGDGFSDTPEIKFDWDRNCDGEIKNTAGNKETNLQCWALLDSTEPVCNLEPNCPNMPCCDSDFINNNVMAYNASQNAYTDQQILSYLEHLATERCDYIQVGGCPPPSAFVSILPIQENEGCKFCFELAGSFNDYHHEFNIYDNQGQSQFSSGIINGNGTRFCVNAQTIKNISNWSNGLVANENYTFELVVENECGDEDIYSVDFSLPQPDCQLTTTPSEPIRIDGFGPNPTTGVMNLNYTQNIITNIQINLLSYNGNSPIIVLPQTLQQTGSYNQSIDMTSYQNGLYSLLIITDIGIQSLSILKE